MQSTDQRQTPASPAPLAKARLLMQQDRTGRGLLDGGWLLAAPSAPVAELLHSTGLERYLSVCPDPPGALATRLAPAGVGSR